MTRHVMVDEQAFLDIIDQMRVSIPEEIRQAKRVNEERERILADAREEAERTLANAQEQAAFLMTEKGLMRQAQAEAERLLAEGRERARQQMIESDEYAMAVLTGLEEELTRLLNTARNGIERLRASHQHPRGE